MAPDSNVSFHGFVPYVYCQDADAMLEWYSRVFGFTERARWRGDDGRVRNAEMRVGDTELWLDGGGKRFRDEQGQPAEFWIGVWVDDVDAMYEQIRAAGVEVDQPEDKPYRVRMLTVTDPEGYHWGFMTRFG